MKKIKLVMLCSLVALFSFLPILIVCQKMGYFIDQDIKVNCVLISTVISMLLFGYGLYLFSKKVEYMPMFYNFLFLFFFSIIALILQKYVIKEGCCGGSTPFLWSVYIISTLSFSLLAYHLHKITENLFFLFSYMVSLLTIPLSLLKITGADMLKVAVLICFILGWFGAKCVNTNPKRKLFIF